MPAFINTDNSNKKRKIYNANLAGESMGAAEDKMKEMVIRAFEKNADFTTNQITNPKGYTLRFEITKFSSQGGDVSCTITGEILRYPKSQSKHGAKDEKVMVNRDWSNSASVSGRGTDAVVQCVEAILELMVPKSIPVMKIDMTRR